MATTLRDAVCTACCCFCDDIELHVEGERIVAAQRACMHGEAWFTGAHDHQGQAATVDGRAASLADAVATATRMLSEARYPLIYGLSNSTCEAQRKAVAIADWTGATIDTPTSIHHGPTGIAFQGVGEVTCTLGEIRNRGDLIIFWGANVAESQPRFFERYSLHAAGMFLPGGRANRKCVVVDTQSTATSAEADVFLRIKPGVDFEALWTLRALAQGIELDAKPIERDTGVPLAAWKDLMQRMKEARFGVLLYGRGLTMTRGKHLNTEAVLALTRDMNAFTRFVCKPLREPGNGTGADDVLTWTTGYPFGVNFSRGFPRFNPDEYTANEILARGEADAVLLIGDDAEQVFDEAARAYLDSITKIRIGSKAAADGAARVAISTSTYGIHHGGTVYRMDDVPLPLRPALVSPLPSDEQVLAMIEERVKSLTAVA